MKLLNCYIVVGALFVGTVQIAIGQGAVIFRQSGATDPTLEGFDYSQSGSGGSVGSVENDLGFAAWSTAVEGGALNVDYGLLFTPEQLAAITSQNWSLSLSLRVVNTDTSAKSYVELGNGAGWYTLRFGAEENGDPFVEIGNESYILSGAGSTYNNYQLVYDVGSGKADIWVNGISAIQDVQQSGYPGNGYVHWGSGMQGGPAQVNWNLVELSVSSVPEPSAIYLIFLGLMGAASLRVARWKIKRRNSGALSAK